MVSAHVGAVSGDGPLSVPRSKFGCPAVPVRAIARPRLAEVLAQPDWRVALVTGRPGAGKTVAVAQWFQALGPIAREWVTLDAGDDQPERFWLTFVLALELAVPGAFTRAAAAATDVHRLPSEFVSGLLTAWSAVTDPLVLVLKDIHHLGSPEINEDLGFVVEHLPGGSRVLLTSRVDPHLPVSRWRGRGWLAELRQRDLALTLPEAAELFTALGEQRLTTSEVESLWRHTEGWVAGLRLAAAGLRDRDDVPAAVAEFSGRTPVVADLLAGELLHRAPAELSEFLVRTSVANVLDWLRIVTGTVIAFLTVANLLAAIHLFHDILTSNKLFASNATGLLATGGVIWATNVIAFALWYWDLDRGGAAARAHHPQGNPAFIFPEMLHTQYVGVRAFLADDDPHSRRPRGQIQQPGDVRDPGSVPDPAVPVIGRGPRGCGHLQDRGLHVLGDRHADRVAQPPGPRGQPLEELVRAASGVGPDQCPAAQPPGQLRQREPGGLDVVGGGVRARVPGAQHDRERFPVPAVALIGPGGHGVEAEGLLPGGRGLLLL